PSTFNNYDYVNNRLVIAPHSPCPVLFGIRGDDPAVLLPAMRVIEGERPERWLIFETNQGTDDHVMRRRSVKPGATVRLSGRVTSPPRAIAGGHVVFRLGDLDVTAYEPSKQFRAVVRSLAPGDRIEAIGAIRRRPKTLNLEKLFVESTAPRFRKVANPWCPECQKRAKSLGRQAGFRCPCCRKHFPCPPPPLIGLSEASGRVGTSRRSVHDVISRCRSSGSVSPRTRVLRADPSRRPVSYTRAVRGAWIPRPGMRYRRSIHSTTFETGTVISR